MVTEKMEIEKSLTEEIGPPLQNSFFLFLQKSWWWHHQTAEMVMHRLHHHHFFDSFSSKVWLWCLSSYDLVGKLSATFPLKVITRWWHNWLVIIVNQVKISTFLDDLLYSGRDLIARRSVRQRPHQNNAPLRILGLFLEADVTGIFTRRCCYTCA